MTQTRRFNLTNRAITALPAHDANSASKSAEYSDTSVTGLKAIVGKGGNKSFSFRYQLAGGRKRCIRIGTFPATDVAAARQLALAARSIVDRGGDPCEASDRIKAMPTFAEFVRDEYMPYSEQAKKGSARDDASKFKVHLNPKFGTRRLCDITTRDVQLHHTTMQNSHSKATANRHLALLSAVFKKGMEWGKLDRNPAAGIKFFKEDNARQRFLSLDEVAKIYAAMKSEPNQIAVAALKLLLLTGTRREEALQARWEHVDLDKDQWWLPKAKTGARMVVLNQDAKDLLAAQPSRGTSPWVFPGRDGDKPLNNPRKAFMRVLAAAGVAHITIHGLRHSFASFSIQGGATLYQVQKLLHHSTPQMTQRYSHLTDTGQLKASQGGADLIGAAVRESEGGMAAA